MNEFEIIREYFAPLTAASEGVVLGIGDDAALLQVPAGHELVVTTDTLVAGRHFPLETSPQDIGWKSLAVNLSDLAAMGAKPRWFTLALTLPEPDTTWLQGFAAGLKALADLHRIALVGGDTTRGPLSITLTAMGLVPQGQALRRDGARVGDLVCVTGTLGDAALGLRLLKERTAAELVARLNRPTPRISAGLALRGLAHAAIDLSDGLAGDLAHILQASGCGALLELEALPMSSVFQSLALPSEHWALQAEGGDDYELCLCLPEAVFGEAQRKLDMPLTAIGRITAEPGLRVRQASGEVRAIPARGYQHF